MASPQYEAGHETGYLTFLWSARPEAQPTCPILSDDEFDIGREDFKVAFGVHEQTISAHHLRFRCVVFNDDKQERVAPMVYVRVLSSNSVLLTRRKFDRDDQAIEARKLDQDILLENGDSLQLTPDLSIIFSAICSSDSRTCRLDRIQAVEAQSFNNEFAVSNRRLGSGGNASVFFALKRSNGKLVACKVLQMPQIQDSNLIRLINNLSLSKQQRELGLKKIERKFAKERESLFREFTVLKKLDHPNIIKLEKVVCATHNLFIFQELITGGDLMSYLDGKGALGEPQSATIIYQLLKAVDYLHSNGIVHRDIKPENILMTESRDGARIVLTDFGAARALGDAKTAQTKAVFRMQTRVGTIGWAAPELLDEVRQNLQQEGYREVVDIWSIGCLAATLLTGTMIFPCDDTHLDSVANARTASQLEALWDTSVLEYGENWLDIKSLPKSFVRDCLVVDESQRMTAREALNHPWLTNKGYAGVLERVYQRAIEDWKPRETCKDLVQVIDTTDAVSTASTPEEVGRFAEEVKSRHFQNPPSATSLVSLLGSVPPQSLPQKRKATPLPQITQEFKKARVEVPVSPSVTQLREILASPLRSPDATQFPSMLANNPMAGCSVLDFAPPHSGQPRAAPKARPSTQSNDSPTQSQVLLDDHSAYDSGIEFD